MNAMEFKLPHELEGQVHNAEKKWTTNGEVNRLWQRDASLWTNDDEGKWLGWMDIVERQQANLQQFLSLQKEIHAEGFTDAVLLGMGGSSLCPEVLEKTFGHQRGYPRLQIVDSTDPAQILAVEKSVNLKKTIFIVSSKSGSTLEPNIFKAYFYERMKQEVGTHVGRHFIAITDPGSHMETVAKQDNFRHIFYGDPSIGGRYSALSDFGIVPAAIMGLDVKRLLDCAQKAVVACRNPQVLENPGVHLGLILGIAATHGRDKITFFCSKKLCDLGAWLEQLLAESTGKTGKGITPVDRETMGTPGVYGHDRVFAFIKIHNEFDAGVEAKICALEAAAQPVVRFQLHDAYEISQQFFIWEVATAVAGSILGINAFNQPDVEASKVETRKLTSEYEQTGKLPEQTPFFSDGDIHLYATSDYAATLESAAASRTLGGLLQAHCEQLKAGDYFAELAYIQMNAEHEAELQSIRTWVRDKYCVATCLGFGPRFLHSTGQDYKGGPNTGVFLQITADHPQDLPVPGAKYTFGVVIAAQAAGDLAVLQQRHRRALRVHLSKGVDAGLRRLCKVMTHADGR